MTYLYGVDILKTFDECVQLHCADIIWQEAHSGVLKLPNCSSKKLGKGWEELPWMHNIKQCWVQKKMRPLGLA